MEITDLIPLSLNQEFVAMFDQGSDDGPFGPRYHIVEAWRVTGEIDTGALQAALDDVVARHEALRTLIVPQEGRKSLQVLPPCQVELTVRDFPASTAGTSREEQAEELIREVEAGSIGASQTPAVRCVLARYDGTDAVLVLMTHHLASDGWSMLLLIRDLAYRYAARKGFSVPELPHAPQYREYVMWQLEGAGAGTDADREFWGRKLAGARFSAIPVDIPRSAGQLEATAAQRFLIPADTVSGIAKTAVTARSSAFMAYVAAYQLLVHRLTGATDVVVATFTPGRGDQLFAETVGSFFNFVPIRTDLAGCRSFGDVLDRTRRSCLEAFSHDIPSLHIFAQAPELMMPAMTDTATAAVFQTSPDPLPLDMPGDLAYARIYRSPDPQSLVSSIPDGVLWDLNMDTLGDVHGTASYKTNLFRPDTVAAMTEQYKQILTGMATNLDGQAGVAG
jgi:condensation enzyme